ncbi:MAG: DUF2441 domain-containing protein [Taibaiella sp.]|nr:DUF2441 domain-containing protein [Taibaiella sp.]
MPEFFHVSRNDISHIKRIINMPVDHEHWYCEAEGFFTKEQYINTVNQLFPQGTTRHGQQYVLSSYQTTTDMKYISHENSIETSFELIRRLKFPNRTSRFEVVFGCLNLEDARQVRRETFGGVGSIYKVECENYFEADMNLLKTFNNFNALMIMADRYWSGYKSENPFMEVLMKPEVKIVGLVE